MIAAIGAQPRRFDTTQFRRIGLRLTPGGLTFVSPGSAPATRQVVTGITVPTSAITDTDQAVLRLVAPGDTGTTAAISLLGPDGVVPLPGAESVDLPAGTVIDVPLAGIPAGSYTAVVRAGAPVLAGAMMQWGGLGLPLIFAGATKIAYDVLLWREFRRVKPPEELEK